MSSTMTCTTVVPLILSFMRIGIASEPDMSKVITLVELCDQFLRKLERTSRCVTKFKSWV